MSFRSLVRKFDPTSSTSQYGKYVAKALDAGASAYGAPPGTVSAGLTAVGEANKSKPSAPASGSASGAASTASTAKQSWFGFATKPGTILVALVVVGVLAFSLFKKR